MPAKNNSNEIKLTRIYDAPVKLVWDAWNDPEQVAQWWGPRGFTLTHHSKDLRPGGHWHYTMHGPDGTDYVNKTIYHEVEMYSRLVYDHGGNDERAPLFRVTVTFTETKGKTRLDFTMTLPTPEAARDTKKFIKQAGGNATWDRLAEYLDKKIENKERFVINRSFETSVDKMYELWTDPKHFLMCGVVEYVEMSKPHRLVYKQQFTDKDGKISRHPHMPNWPETMLTIVTFNAEGPDETRVTVIWEPVGNITSEELAAFIKERGGMTQGWTGSFDKLEELIAKN